MSRLLLLLLAVATPARAADLVAAGETGVTRERPVAFTDADGRPAVGVFRNHPDRAGEITFHYAGDEGWSSGGEIPLTTGNLRMLQDVAAVGGLPVAFYLYDDIDYATVIGVDTSGEPGTEFPYPGEDLRRLMNEARAVFVSQLIDGRWGPAIQVPRTRGARSMRAVTDGSGALILFDRDEDGDLSTRVDGELEAVVWTEGEWRDPIALTDDAAPTGAYAAIAVDGGWLVAWGTDADGDPYTDTDFGVRAARIDADGQLVEQADLSGPFGAASPPVPVWAWRDGQPVVLWVEEDTTVECVYDGTWGVPSGSGMPAIPLDQARALPDGEGASLLVVRVGTGFAVARPEETGWVIGAPFYDAADDGLLIREWDATVTPESLVLAVTGRVGAPGALGADVGEGLYAVEVPLGADVEVQALAPIRRRVAPGEPFDARVRLRNTGTVAAEGLVIAVTGGRLADPEDAALGGLAPGEAREVTLSMVVDDTASRWGVQVSHAAADLDPSDDALDLPSPVRPDFRVQALEVDGTTVRVDVRELSGVLAPPVDVEVHLQTEAGMVPLETYSFDSRDPRPHIVTTELLATAEPPYRVVARVNPARSVQEADYSNNLAGEQVTGGINFRPIDAEVLGAEARVAVVAEATTEEQTVWVFLTSDPQAATGALRSDWTGDATAVTIPPGEVGRVTVPAPADGDFLYAVVNPGRVVAEPLREDNILRFARSRRSRAESDLAVYDHQEFCGNLHISLRNAGDAPALGSYLTVYAGDMPVAERVVPPVPAGGEATVAFDLAEGTYTVALSRPDRTQPDVVETALDPIVPGASVDADGDGFASRLCGGSDCDDADASAYPGSWGFDDVCRPKNTIGCAEGCSSSQASTGWFVAALAALGARRRARRVSR